MSVLCLSSISTSYNHLHVASPYALKMQSFLLLPLASAAIAIPAAKPPTCSQHSQNCAPKVSTYCSSYLSLTASTTTSTVSSGVA